MHVCKCIQKQRYIHLGFQGHWLSWKQIYIYIYIYAHTTEEADTIIIYVYACVCKTYQLWMSHFPGTRCMMPHWCHTCLPCKRCNSHHRQSSLWCSCMWSSPQCLCRRLDLRSCWSTWFINNVIQLLIYAFACHTVFSSAGAPHQTC